MKSLRLDEELCGWSERLAVERGVSWASVVEDALRGLQAGVMAEAVPERGGVHVLAAAAKKGPTRIDSPEDARSWYWERQKRLNRAKGL